jgi:hypothetical protein
VMPAGVPGAQVRRGTINRTKIRVN